MKAAMSCGRLGFSLVELLVVIAGIAVLSGGGYMTAVGVQQTAAANKLESDVATLNRAIEIYQANGGSLSGIQGAADAEHGIDILRRLKQKGSAGVGTVYESQSSLVDPRVKAEWMSTSEAASSRPRAVWDSGSGNFVVRTSGSGVKRFVMDDAAAVSAAALETAARDSTKAVSPTGWVWDFASTAPDTRTTGTSVVPNPVVASSGNGVVSEIQFPEGGNSTSGGGGGDAVASGVLIAFGTFENAVTINGSVTMALRTDANGNYTTSNLTLKSTSKVLGNMYLAGTPAIYKDHVASSQYDNQLWSTATDANFSNYIIGNQYDDSGNLVDPPDASFSSSPRVIDLDGDPKPDNYYVLLQESAKVYGKIYRRTVPYTLPTVAAPATKSNSNYFSLNSDWQFSQYNPNRLTLPINVNPAQTANVQINLSNFSTFVPDGSGVNLLPGNYGAVSASQNATLVLGNASDPTTVQEYTFESLSLSGGADIKIVGPVKITVNSGSFTIYDGGVVGNSSHPEWLKVYFYSTAVPSEWYVPEQFLLAANSTFYGQIVAPKTMVTLQENSNFSGSVTAYKLNMTGNAGANIKFNLAPLTE